MTRKEKIHSLFQDEAGNFGRDICYFCLFQDNRTMRTVQKIDQSPESKSIKGTKPQETLKEQMVRTEHSDERTTKVHTEKIHQVIKHGGKIPEKGREQEDSQEDQKPM